MPVTYNKEKDKWCVGTRCVYDTKKDAHRAYLAYLAKKHTESGGLQEEGFIPLKMDEDGDIR